MCSFLRLSRLRVERELNFPHVHMGSDRLMHMWALRAHAYVGLAWEANAHVGVAWARPMLT